MDYTATAWEIARAVRAGRMSAREVLDAFLERMSRVEGLSGRLLQPGEDPEALHRAHPGVHAFITPTLERARRQAEEVDRKVAAGQDPGPLAGVPITVKDILTVEGTRTTAGSRILYEYIAPYTATAIARLEAAGAVVLGKVNLDEFTFGSSGESTAYQPAPRNPWDLERVPGGSSSGSAAAVAAGMGPISIGTDTAGSIRQPAAFCGVVGLKPTYGRVSRYGLIAYASSYDTVGPLARTVTDAALALQVMAGPDPHDATAATRPVPDYLEIMRQGVRGLRIGLSPDMFRITYVDQETGQLVETRIDPEIEQAVYRAADVLADMGAAIVDGVPLPHLPYGIPVYFVVSRVEAASNLHRYDGVKYGFRAPEPVTDFWDMYRKTRGQGFGLQPKVRILMGMYVSAAQYSQRYYERALRVRTLIRQDFQRLFDPHGPYRLHLLLGPTTPTPAFRFGEVYGDTVLMQYMDQLLVAANHAGIPAVSVPAGLNEQGLPLSVQFMAPDFREDLLLRAAYAYEQFRGGPLPVAEPMPSREGGKKAGP